MTHSFFGGVYPATRKDNTKRKPMTRLSQTPREIVIPLLMCSDGPSTPLVSPGDPVTVGQPIARRGETGAAAHASVSGRVRDLVPWPHPWGGQSPAIHPGPGAETGGDGGRGGHGGRRLPQPG